MLLGVLIAFPEEAVRFLDNIGELGPSAKRDTSLWSEYMATLDDADLRSMVERMSAATGRANSTREPFRAWALEISRYSFATGQEVFARYHARQFAPTGPPAPASKATA